MRPYTPDDAARAAELDDLRAKVGRLEADLEQRSALEADLEQIARDHWAEVERLRATVARVEAAIDRVDETKSATIMVSAIRAALEGEPMSAHVDPAWIEQQRSAGWPDIHPEDYCHRCGNRNPLWAADRDDWLTATSAWAAETGREGICCPTCFIEMHAEATGTAQVWRLAPHDRSPRDPR